MEKHQENEKFGLSQDAFDFDIDFDVTFGIHEYLFLILYTLLIMPFVLSSELLSRFFRKAVSDNAATPTEKPEGLESFGPGICVGPCCLLPEPSHR